MDAADWIVMICLKPRTVAVQVSGLTVIRITNL